MFIGVRVVRGPDWKWDDQDGGKGCVGTVVPAQAKDSGTGIWVRWDSGRKANYRAGGANGTYDLRIYDNAQLGVKHPNIICKGCQEDGVVGIRWKCLECHDFDLCHSCYNEGKHGLDHRFTRIETNLVPGVEVPCRSGATKCRSLGIFPGAQVVRGPDWEWEDQDGGEGIIGTVKEVFGTQGTHRSLVSVQWPNGKTNKYRVGYKGKLDVQYKQEDTAGEFFIDHLPNFDGTRVRPYLDTGDKVRLLDMDHLKLKELQEERNLGWNEEIKDYCGKVGEVVMVDKDGDVKVNFGGSSFFINPLCIAMEKKKEAEDAGTGAAASELNLGGLLATLLLKAQIDTLGSMIGESAAGRGRGEVLFDAAAGGVVHKVRNIINDDPETVKFQNDQGVTPLHIAAHCGHVDVVHELLKGKAPLQIPDAVGDAPLMTAVFSNKPNIVRILLIAGSNVNATNNGGLTALHLASYNGFDACAEALLGKPECDVNCQESDGHTPLTLASAQNKEQIILWLINDQRTDLRQVNKKGLNSLHQAVLCGSTFAVEGILRKSPDMINVARTDGHTALHLAALNGLTEITLILVKQVNCNKELKNNVGKTALHLAIDKTHDKCMEALVTNGANVNAQDNDGNTSLHLLMIEDAVKAIMRGTPMGQLLRLGHQLQEPDERARLVALALYLIKYGADIYIKNKAGDDVLDLTLDPAVEKLIKRLFKAKRFQDSRPQCCCTVS
ncbi:E3 ubiquitin-protein ligase MIB2-like [Patiria miniata]|uniref:RING-type E3 ubiquitin transferase n=1 Tax=Patiria miniata TaxID=46514 RepID=A0A914ACK9_PATMI|nr:E3 ubiquitin-protein ligase MIB2-like [Patiria miniata]